MTDKIITKKEVEYVAELANLDFSQGEKEEYTEQLNAILGYFKKLNELDTGNVQPTAYIFDMPNLMSKDVIEKSLSQEKVMSLSDISKKGYFKVPKIM